MLATAVSNNLAESRTNKFPFMAASVGGLFQFVRLWHFADKPTTPGFVAYWTNNGQRAAFALCVPKTSSNTLELAGPRWLTWRRLVCSSSPSASS